MKKLPMYPPNAHLAPIDKESPLKLDECCTRCPRGATTRQAGHTACMQPMVIQKKEFTETWLVLGGEPNQQEYRSSKIFGSIALRTFFEDIAGPHVRVIFDKAIRCGHIDTEDKKHEPIEAIDPCRGYLKRVIDKAKPDRIFTFGGHATYAVLGRRPDEMSLQHAYAYLGDKQTKVFMFQNYNWAFQSTFATARLFDCIRWAVTAEPKLPPYDAYYLEVENENDSKAAVKDIIARGPHFGMDAETSGVFGEDHFRILEVTYGPVTTPDEVEFTYCFPEDMLDKTAVKDHLRFLHGRQVGVPTEVARESQVLGREIGTGVPKHLRMPGGHNISYDLRVMYKHLDLNDMNDNTPILDTEIWCDTMGVTKMKFNLARMGLAVVGERVGMGGHKEPNDIAVKYANDEIMGFIQQYVDNGYNPNKLLTFANRDRKTLTAACRVLSSMLTASGKISGGENNIKMFSFARVPTSIRRPYCNLDTLAYMRAAVQAREDIFPSAPREEWTEEQQRMNRLWVHAKHDDIRSTVQLETWGLPTQKAPLLFLHKEATAVVTKCDAYLDEAGFKGPYTDAGFREWLYGDEEGQLGYEALEHTKAGLPSVSMPALQLLEQKLKVDKGASDPIISCLQERSAADKIVTSFSATMAARVTTSGNIHPSFLPFRTATGRWSSENPNCFSGDTEVLTEDGWVRLDAIQLYKDDIMMRVAQFNPNTKQIEFAKPQDFIKVDAVFMTQIKHRDFDHVSICCTEDHQQWIEDIDGGSLQNRIFDCAVEASDLTLHTTEQLGIEDGFLRVAGDGLPNTDIVNASDVDLADLGHYDRVSLDRRSDLDIDTVQAVAAFGGQAARALSSGDVVLSDRKLITARGLTAKVTLSEDGHAYCLSMPKGTLLLRHNNFVFVSRNCQNLPSRGVWAKRFKQALAPTTSGLTMFQLDWSNIEYREAAIISGDPKFIQVFKDGEDPHRATAMLAWDLEGASEEVILEHRQKAKCVGANTRVYVRGKGLWNLKTLVKRKMWQDCELLTMVGMNEDGSCKMGWEKPNEVFLANHQDDFMYEVAGPGSFIRVTADHHMLSFNDNEVQKIPAQDLVDNKNTKIEIRQGGSMTHEEHPHPIFEGMPEEQVEALYLVVALVRYRSRKTNAGRPYTINVESIDSLLKIQKIFETAGLTVMTNPHHRTAHRKGMKDKLHKTKTRIYSMTTCTKSAKFLRDSGLIEMDMMEAPTKYKKKMLAVILRDINFFMTITLKEIHTLIGMAATAGVNYVSTWKDNPRDDGITLLRIMPQPVTDKRNVKVKKINRKAKVGCVDMPSGYLVGFVNGQASIIGNTINFGLIYGQQVFTLAANLGITEQAAQEMVDEVLGKYSRLAEWIQETHDFVVKNGYVYTYMWHDGQLLPMGKCYLPDAGHNTEGFVRKDKRRSVNYICQGSSAVMMSQKVWQVISRILKDPAKYLGTKIHNVVHDSVVGSSPHKKALGVMEDIKVDMEIKEIRGVPITTDAECSSHSKNPSGSGSWGNMKPLKDLQKVANMLAREYSDAEIALVLGMTKALEDFIEGSLDDHKKDCELLGLTPDDTEDMVSM